LAQAQSAAQDTTGANDAKDAKPHSALKSSSPSSSVDLSGLTRNTFIIMGLLGCIILMLILLVTVVLLTRGNKGYRAVSTTSTVPLAAPYQSKYNQYSRTSTDDKYQDS
jgi:hypothetical protein